MCALDRNIGSLQFAPIAELVIASVLTLFLYAPGAMTGITKDTDRDDVWIAYYFGMVSGMPVFIPPYLSRDVWMEKQSSGASYDIIYHISIHDENTPHLVLNDFKKI